MGAPLFTDVNANRAAIQEALKLLPTADTFGVMGDGVTDDTAALQLAASAGGIVLPKGMVVKVNGEVMTRTHVSCFVGDAEIIQYADAPIFSTYGAFDAGRQKSISGTLDAGDRSISMDTTASFNVGEWIFVRAGDLLPHVTSGSRLSTIRRIIAKTATVLSLDAPFYRTMTTGLSIIPINLLPRTYMQGVKFSHIDKSNFEPLLKFGLCEGPDLHEVRLEHSGGPGLYLSGVIGGSFNNSRIFDLTDDIGAGHYGYGVLAAGVVRGFQFLSGEAEQCRHAATTGAGPSSGFPADLQTLMNQRGEPEHPFWGPVYCHNTSEAALDTHAQGYGVIYQPNVHGCVRGVGIRATKSVINGGIINGVSRHAILVTGPSQDNDGSASIEAEINDLVITNVKRNTNDGIVLNIEVPGAHLNLNNVTISDFYDDGIYVINGSTINATNLKIDGGDPSRVNRGLILEGPGNRILGGVIKNCDVGIYEGASGSDNSWNWVEFSNNNTDESRVPTYVPKNRHNRYDDGSSGAAGAINDHEIPLGFFVSGRYYTFTFGSVSTLSSIGNGGFRLYPVRIRERITIDQIACEITAGGSSGAVARLGIYKDNGYGYPGALLIDAGTVVATAIAAPASSISQVIEPGLYWFAAALQGAPVSEPTFRTSTGGDPSIGALTMLETIQSANVGYGTTGITGALPSTFPAGATKVASAIRIGVRIA